jgi:hypothetical protein
MALNTITLSHVTAHIVVSILSITHVKIIFICVTLVLLIPLLSWLLLLICSLNYYFPDLPPLQASDNFNAEEFAQACADFDRISPLDPWKTTVLLKAKRHIDAAAGGGDVSIVYAWKIINLQ